MEASVSSRVIALPISRNSASAVAGQKSGLNVGFLRTKRNNRFILTRRSVSPIEDVPVVFDPVQADITWQIVVGAIAGVTPFVVAGIEFSKRIIQQKNCAECGGSGLVLTEKKYFRCPSCGGFLPWQSWKRFFSG